MSERARSAFLVSLLLLVACTDRGDLPTSQEADERERIRARVEEMRARYGDYLPYGLSVPKGDTAWLPPEPYNPDRHGPLVARELRAPTWASWPERHSGTSHPFPPPEVVNSGAQASDSGHVQGIWEIIAGYGSYAIHTAGLNADIHPDFNSPDTVVVYAPIFLGDNNTCLEQVSAHVRPRFSSVTKHYIGFWNHCPPPGGGVGAEQGWVQNNPVELDLDKQADWVRFSPELFDDIVSLSVFYNWRNGNSAQEYYAGIVYNYSFGYWEGITPEVDQLPTSHYDGWIGWEAWHIDDVAPLCLDFDPVQLAEAEVYLVPKVSWPLNSSRRGAWVPDGYCWQFGIYFMQEIWPYTHWKSLTP